MNPAHIAGILCAAVAIPAALMLRQDPPQAPAAPYPDMTQVAEISLVAIDPGVRQGGLVRGRAQGLRELTLDGRPLPTLPDGSFLLGFGRDAPATARLTATFANGSTHRQILNIAPGTWTVRNLPTLPRGTARTPQAIAARAAEIVRIDTARAALQPVLGWRQPFHWPVTGRISGVFGSQTIYAGEPGSYHGGIDIARPAGTSVRAPADGIVVLASPPQYSVEGNLLILDHGLGLSSAFLHLSRIDVAVGTRVTQGDLLGAIGTTGRSTGPHLHWGMVWRGVRVDPARVAGAMSS